MKSDNKVCVIVIIAYLLFILVLNAMLIFSSGCADNKQKSCMQVCLSQNNKTNWAEHNPASGLMPSICRCKVIDKNGKVLYKNSIDVGF